MKKAFTLAEVLITLGIIGVIASISIPSLIGNYQKKVTVTKLKHTYSIISQAIKTIEQDEGSIDIWNINDIDWSKYLKTIKTLPYKTWPNSCTNTPQEVFTTWYILNNGVCITAASGNSDIMSFWFDLNGKKGPNKSGHDRFHMVIVKHPTYLTYWYGSFQRSGLYFYGNGWTRDTMKRSNIGTGGAIIMLDGWQIKDDYPFW